MQIGIITSSLHTTHKCQHKHSLYYLLSSVRVSTCDRLERKLVTDPAQDIQNPVRVIVRPVPESSNDCSGGRPHRHPLRARWGQHSETISQLQKTNDKRDGVEEALQGGSIVDSGKGNLWNRLA